MCHSWFFACFAVLDVNTRPDYQVHASLSVKKTASKLRLTLPPSEDVRSAARDVFWNIVCIGNTPEMG